eukprot:CAMPEP_0185020976 /NCGR_PEP_ID=MMETSP1103-20130426/3624_1 /TAXON_ID=36769 /ORGANISM="Paraphysomonas bandaiensis, Strain Caron Lab Isolate" /LENGTH=103 /DNA_ID=CAMNT_0027552211 /DNA_START=48 /DNA_END=359 /DNA_ORIENTATION=+
MRARKFTPQVLAIIDEAARKVFNHRPVVQHRTGFKLLAKTPYGPVAAKYYPPDLTRSFKKLAKDYTTDLEERRQDKLVRLRARGKGPPKKGHGNRAKKGGKKR